MKWLVTKEWIEGPNKGVRWKEFHKRKMVIGLTHERGNSTAYKVIDQKETAIMLLKHKVENGEI
jgi:hypothetical protein